MGDRFWVDQGGTFTDVLRVDSQNRLTLHKVLSAYAQSEYDGVLRKGTTVATNALLEGKAQPIVLLVNAGFGDLLEIGDQRREIEDRR